MESAHIIFYYLVIVGQQCVGPGVKLDRVKCAFRQRFNKFCIIQDILSEHIFTPFVLQKLFCIELELCIVVVAIEAAVIVANAFACEVAIVDLLVAKITFIFGVKL